MFSRLVVALIAISLFTRFVGLNWGGGFFFHPDENNMGQVISQFSSSNFNPHFFAYGQFPLYLGYFSLKVFHLNNAFPNSIYILRFWSAIFSILSIFLIYFISQKIFKNRSISLTALILSIFHPGLIQIGHFGTTESLLIFLFLLNIYFSLLLVQTKRYRFLLFSSLVSGIAISTKISSVFFLIPIFISWLSLRLSKKSILYGFLFVELTILFYCLSSPYNLLNFSDFISSMRYETEVATGAIRVFYTSQFLSSMPYLFQTIKIFPYINGLPIYIFSISGFILFLKNKSIRNILILIFPILIFFVYYGQLYVKWTRFMSPIFFIFPIFAAYFICRIKNRYLTTLFIIISIIPGLFFLNLYFQPDIRLQASDWIDNNLPRNSNILSEAGNVVNIPLNTTHSYNVDNFDFYNLDSNQELATQLVSSVNQSDYILIPSRRIFKNQYGSKFPISQCYYQSIFSGDLGFEHLKTFSLSTSFLLNSENAEETWSVFDQPTIRLFKKDHSVPLICQK